MTPSDIVYHDGNFIPRSQATLGVQDRGVLFADGVYEVVRYDRGRPFAMGPHVQRLRNSLAGIELPGVDAEEVGALSDELVKRNGLEDGKVYWQVTRGPQTRDFVMPDAPTPSVTLIAYPAEPLTSESPLAAGSAIVADDCRWTCCGVKSLLLLPASLAKTRARKQGAVEAIFERAKPGGTDRHITEGSSTNLFIIRGNTLHTHPLDGWVLPGVTRQILIELAASHGWQTREQPFTREAMLGADEVFVCSTTQLTAITSIDGRAISSGAPGPVTDQLHAAYRDMILG